MDNLDELKKILTDFVNDLLITFPELKETLDDNLHIIHNYNALDNGNALGDSNGNNEELTKVLEAVKNIKTYLGEILPERFFDILYENVEMFDNEELDLKFLPGIDFRVLWNENISDSTRETIWKYLKLLLFAVVSNISDSESFGDTAKLFEAINADELKSKLEETISSMSDMFDMSMNMCGEGEGNEEEGEETDSSLNQTKGMPNASKIHENLQSILKGKLGALAEEIAEECAKDFDIDTKKEITMKDIYKKIFKQPTKLMSMVKNIGSKIDSKIKSGELSQSELLSEANELMKNMKNVPGMGNIQNILGKFGLGKGKNSKINVNEMQANLQQNLKLAQQKERMMKKLREKEQKERNTVSEKEFKEKEKKADEVMYELLQMENELVFRSGGGAERSKRRSADSVVPQQNKVKKAKKKKKVKKDKKN